MPQIDTFYSTEETKKPVSERVHHDSAHTCETGQNMAEAHRKAGSGGYPLCKECLAARKRASEAL